MPTSAQTEALQLLARIVEHTPPDSVSSGAPVATAALRDVLAYIKNLEQQVEHHRRESAEYQQRWRTSETREYNLAQRLQVRHQQIEECYALLKKLGPCLAALDFEAYVSEKQEYSKRVEQLELQR